MVHVEMPSRCCMHSLVHHYEQQQHLTSPPFAGHLPLPRSPRGWMSQDTALHPAGRLLPDTVSGGLMKMLYVFAMAWKLLRRPVASNA
jgi:hypothetical protein